MLKIRAYFGLGGISGVEKASIRFLGRVFDFLMAVVAFFLFAEWHLAMSGLLTNGTEIFINWVIFLFFAVRFFLLLYLVQDKHRYTSYNWFSILAMVLWFPLLFSPHFGHVSYQIIRPLLALCMFLPWLGLLRVSLMDGKLFTTLISLVFVVVISGVVITGVDPGIRNVGDGIWWAWVTMSTVGYGDYVPITVAGRIIASIVILLGLCFFAVLTANFSRIFIRRDVSLVKAEENSIQNREKRIEKRLAVLEEKLDRLLEQKRLSDD